jgi:hypothetical protein
MGNHVAISRSAMLLSPLLAPLPPEDCKIVKVNRFEVFTVLGDVALEFSRTLHLRLRRRLTPFSYQIQH